MSTIVIYINDIFQGNIKVYDISGLYIRTFSTRWKNPSGREVVPRGTHSILVLDGIVYVQCEYGGIPPADRSAIYILTYDLETGKWIERIDLYNPAISRKDGDRAYTVNATDLKVGKDNSVWIYDSIHDTSFPVVRDGKKVPIEEHAEGIPGAVFGSRRMVLDLEKNRRILVGQSGSLIRDLNTNETYKNIVNWKISAKNGRYFVRHNIFKADFIITTWDGRDIGRVKWKHQSSWNTYHVGNLLFAGPDGRFYHIFTGNDGIHVYRWSK